MFQRVVRLGGFALLGCALFVAGLWMLVRFLQDGEAKYEGKTVADWATLVAGNDAAAANDARKLVTGRVIPALRDRMFNDTNDFEPKFKLIEQLNQLPHVYIFAADADTRRADAARSLGQFGTNAATAISDLIQGVKGKDELVRQAAIDALGKIQTEPGKTIPLLIECLDDENEEIKICATKALGEYGPAAKAAVPKLVPFLTYHSKELPPATRRSLAQIDPTALVAKKE